MGDEWHETPNVEEIRTPRGPVGERGEKLMWPGRSRQSPDPGAIWSSDCKAPIRGWPRLPAGRRPTTECQRHGSGKGAEMEQLQALPTPIPSSTCSAGSPQERPQRFVVVFFKQTGFY